MIYLPANIYCYSTKPRSHTKSKNVLVTLCVILVSCPFPFASATREASGARGTLLALTVRDCHHQRDVGGEEVIHLVALCIVGGGEGKGGKEGG